MAATCIRSTVLSTSEKSLLCRSNRSTTSERLEPSEKLISQVEGVLNGDNHGLQFACAFRQHFENELLADQFRELLITRQIPRLAQTQVRLEWLSNKVNLREQFLESSPGIDDAAARVDLQMQRQQGVQRAF